MWSRKNRNGENKRNELDSQTYTAALIENHLRQAITLANTQYALTEPDEGMSKFLAAQWIMTELANLWGVELRVMYPLMDRLEDSLVWKRYGQDSNQTGE